MKISAIIPCFNSAGLIVRAIESILNQTFGDFELIVVDDASTDGTPEIVESVPDRRVKLVRLPENRGYPGAMSEGIRVARGEYIARMDSDDICLASRFEEQLEALRLFPRAAFCGLNRFLITPGGNTYIRSGTQCQNKYIEESNVNIFDNNRVFTDASVMIEKSKLDAVGGYRTFQRSGMDVDLWLRAMERYGPCVTITTPLYGRRLDPNSLVYNPRTYLINQIPRVLALQRKHSGVDDVQLGLGADLDKYLGSGLVKRPPPGSGSSLLVGALADCLLLGDLKGSRAFFRRLMANSPGGHGKLLAIAAISRKLLGRFRRNPFRPYSPPIPVERATAPS